MSRKQYFIWLLIGLFYLVVTYLPISSYDMASALLKLPTVNVIQKDIFDKNTSMYNHALWGLALDNKITTIASEDALKIKFVKIEKNKIIIGEEIFECVGIFSLEKKVFAIFENLNTKNQKHYIKLYEGDKLLERVQLLKVNPFSLELFDREEQQTLTLKQFEVNPSDYKPKPLEKKQ